jgi:acyl-CoA reductase-like NAD-dependent aldehyde dehydrogenase
MKSKVYGSWLLSGIAALFLCFGSEAEKTTAATMAQEPPPQQTQNLDKARALIKDQKFAEAETLARELLKQAEAAPGADSLKVAEVLDVLVESLWRGGKARAPESQKTRRAGGGDQGKSPWHRTS